VTNVWQFLAGVCIAMIFIVLEVLGRKEKLLNELLKKGEELQKEEPLEVIKAGCGWCTPSIERPPAERRTEWSAVMSL